MKLGISEDESEPNTGYEALELQEPEAIAPPANDNPAPET